MSDNDTIDRAVSGSLNESGTSSVFSASPDTPVYATLTGTWTGTATVERSFDGATWAALTLGGELWATYTANCNEAFDEPQRGGILFRINFERSSGTLTYRLGH